MKSYAAAISLPLKMKDRVKPRNEGSFYNLEKAKDKFSSRALGWKEALQWISFYFLFFIFFNFYYFFLFLVFYFLNFKIFNSYMHSQTWTPLPPPSP